MASIAQFQLPCRSARPAKALLRAPERLFEFQRGRKVVACELRDHGKYGVEAVFLEDGELFYSWRFETRKRAAGWAEVERSVMGREASCCEADLISNP